MGLKRCALMLSVVLIAGCAGGHGSSSVNPPLSTQRTNQTANAYMAAQTVKSAAPSAIGVPPMGRSTIEAASAMASRTPKSQIQPASWTQLPGSAQSAVASPDGSLWVISNVSGGPGGNTIWHYVNGAWTQFPGAATRLAVGPDGSLWALSAQGAIYTYLSAMGFWAPIAGGASDIAVGADNAVYIVANDHCCTGGSSIWQYVGGNPLGGHWVQLPGAGVRIAASWDAGSYPDVAPGGFFLTTAQNTIYYYTSSIGYTELPGAAVQVAATNVGGLVALGNDAAVNHSIWYFDLSAGTWTQEPGAAATISANSTTLYAIANGGIYASPLHEPTLVGATPAPGTIPVLASSYLNAKTPNLGPQALPVIQGSRNGAPELARAYADFFQDGQYSLFIATAQFNDTDPSEWPLLGSLHFYKNVNGVWVDSTSTLLADNTGCHLARKAIVADFNGDGKPDIFVACTGLDVPPGVGPQGERSLVVLSQPDGTYKTTRLPYTGYYHGASAAELTSKGYADIVVVDPAIVGHPYFLLNNHDGTFTQDFTRVPAMPLGEAQYTTELIDFDGTGKYDLFLAGTNPGGFGSADCTPTCTVPTVIYKNTGDNRYSSASMVTLPDNLNFGLTLDIVYENSTIYLLRTESQPTPYAGTDVQKISYPSLAASDIYTHTGPYPCACSGVVIPTTWIPWLDPFNGTLVSDDLNAAATIQP